MLYTILVSFGGIAGLFLGFSLLSGAELLYWIFAGVALCIKYNLIPSSLIGYTKIIHFLQG
jgi:hypothetical protein